MKLRNILPAFAVTALASAAIPSFAAPPPPPPPPPPPMMRPLPLPDLIQRHAQLSPEQVKEVKKIMEAKHANVEVRHREVEALDAKIVGAVLASERVDRDALTALVKQKVALHQQAEEQRVDELARIHDVLTPAQREAVRKAWANEMAMAAKHHPGPPPLPAR